VAYDPVAGENARRAIGNSTVQYVTTLGDAVQDTDGAVILTEWDEFRKADWRSLASNMVNPLLIDLRNLFTLQEASSIGIKYVSLGRNPIEISN
jgi:UDPglucose 6-dehydrogenase